MEKAGEEGKEGGRSFATSMELRFWHLQSGGCSMEARGHQLVEAENCTFEKRHALWTTMPPCSVFHQAGCCKDFKAVAAFKQSYPS